VAALKWDIEMFNGRTFTLRVACKTVSDTTGAVSVRDLTGWTGAMQIRPTTDDDTVYADADVTIDTATGIVTATVTDEDTAAATWRAGVYDLVITDGVDPDTLVFGTARLRRSTTR
jgi:hypothetical protein